MLKLSILFLSACFMLTSIFSAQAQAKGYELQIQTSLATASIYYKTLERLKDNIETLSNGKIKVQLFGDGAIVKNFEIFDSVSENIINGGMCWTHWSSGKHPAGTLFSAPVGGLGLGLDQMSQLAWMWEGDGNKLLNEYYQEMLDLDIVAFPVLPMGPESFGWFNQKYTRLEEFNKVTFRAPPGVPSEVFKDLGMPVVSMGGGDIVPAAQRGVIDAAEWIAPAEDIVMGLSAIWKHYYLQGLHQAISIGDVYINRTWYNALPKDLQAIIQVAMKVCVLDQLLGNITENSKALRTLVQDHGVIIEETPAEYYPAFMKSARTVIAKYTKDPFFKKVYESQREWAELTVPLQVRSNGLYYMMGKAAMDAGIITDYKK